MITFNYCKYWIKIQKYIPLLHCSALLMHFKLVSELHICWNYNTLTHSLYVIIIRTILILWFMIKFNTNSIFASFLLMFIYVFYYSFVKIINIYEIKYTRIHKIWQREKNFQNCNKYIAHCTFLRYESCK